jgi:hypothetical protein
MGRFMNISFSKLLFLPFLSILMSCSGSLTHQTSSSYLSPEYEDMSYEGVSMDICIPESKFDYNSGLDSITVANMNNFNENFRKYFPEGIRMFSSVDRVGWIFYDVDHNKDFNEYEIKRADGSHFYIDLPEPLNSFQSASSSDFLFIIQNIFPGYNKQKASEAEKKIVTIIRMEYSVWNRKNLDLIAKDIVESKMESVKISDKWPFRTAILKLAAEVSDKLPMFSK